MNRPPDNLNCTPEGFPPVRAHSFSPSGRNDAVEILGAQPPRLLFGAPSRRTRAAGSPPNGSLFARVSAGREGATRCARGGRAPFSTATPDPRPARPAASRAFSLIEVLVVVTLLTVVVLALMDVFGATQRAFRAAVTQTDVLEGSRAAMDLIATDLRTMTPSNGYSNGLYNTYDVYNGCGVGFYASLNPYAAVVYQNLPGSVSGTQRANVLEEFFCLSRANLNGRDNWVGTGYAVDGINTRTLFPLYRFTTNAPAVTDPAALFNSFMAGVSANVFTNTGWSHLLDGVIHLTVQPYDLGGYPMTNTVQFKSGQSVLNRNVMFYSPVNGYTACYFYSNVVPASVELQMAVIEDRALQRAQSLAVTYSAVTNYLAGQSGTVHVFRQIVTIPNVDRSAYQ
ncbi:MAG TPA: prepilin-type N-terminal cleavage/methylation domain-containing protein [Candidatus Sulfotelmatobacter sp.]|jgi:type II secretory pathway pseudopilin PulG|nr:prepilin-type N-terminal cleavage/methylation domain-containing protein [Candidatus Sulfotelmatobacter sp.]